MTTQPVTRNVPYVAAFTLLNSNAQPYSGNMTLNFNHGKISGTYTDTSLKPGGPLYNRRNVPVSGGVNSSGHATLLIGPLSFHGTLSGEWFSGSATVNGRIYTFKARQGSPGKPAP
ncbi:MAG: hypothetical protein WA629_11910 [Candidatus Aquilonibacter sp.]